MVDGFRAEPEACLGRRADPLAQARMAREFDRAQGEDGGVPIDASKGLLKELIAEVYGDAATLNDVGDNPVVRWYAIGARLKHGFNIVQYAFVRWNTSLF